MDRPTSLTTVLGRSLERGLSLTSGQLNASGRRAVAIYRLVEGRDPGKVPEIIRHSTMSDFETLVYGYPRTHVPMCIDKSIDSVLEGAPPPVKGKRLWQRGPMMRDPLAEKPAQEPPARRPEIRSEGGYFISRHTCWSCEKEMSVYTWDGHMPWGSSTPPPAPTPPTIRFAFSSTVGHEYWANVCPSCDSLQGDYFLHLTPTGPFSGLKSNAVIVAICKQRDLCSGKGIPMFAPEDGLCWSCRRQVYEEYDGSAHITGCPFCHRSFCD